MKRVAPPVLIVVFGASGDLAKRKLIPALYHLAHEELLSDYIIVGFARSRYSDEEFRTMMLEGLREHMGSEHRNGGVDDARWRDFVQHLYYQTGNYDDSEAFRRLGQRIDELEAAHQTGGNRLFYLATPPEVFQSVTTLLKEHKLPPRQRGEAATGWARLIIEKPFGRDLESARALNDHLAQLFAEEQIYRIDHYLGKETVQNILVFRFGNGIFEPIWNRNYIDHVQITVAESLGVGDRGGYYEQAGAIRDMVQNHVMQLVALTAMEPPVAFDAKAVRDQKVNVLQSIRPLAAEQVLQRVVRAQYGPGSINGKEVVGYRENKGIAANSTTDTYIAWKVEIDNWRWNGVPFYLRTGKALPTKRTEINIVFRKPPLRLFEGLDADSPRLRSNVLTLRIQPDESICLSFDAKRPGPIVDVDPVAMNFSYSSFGQESADAYERLLFDAILGDGTLFIRRDEIEVAWERVTRILDSWQQQEAAAAQAQQPLALPTYPAGSWGPLEADTLLTQDGRYWRNGD
jgi:glucose-6-phosphate 1-dehydrogenase